MNTELWIKAISAAAAIAGLLIGLYKYVGVQEIEAAKPFLEKKLQWCEEVVEVTAALAVVPDQSAEKRFLQMYWGVLGMVERESIIEAMNAFKTALENNTVSGSKSLAIAHACREELSGDWSAKWSR